MDDNYGRQCYQELRSIKEMLQKVLGYLNEAESEVSEKMRRFIMYMHDLHDVSYLYESRGHPVPEHVMRELERCDDRYRQLLEEAHSPGGTFERVRRKMAEDRQNKWDHTKQLPYMEKANEARQSRQGQHDGAVSDPPSEGGKPNRRDADGHNAR